MFGPERIGRLLAGIVLLSVMVPFHTAFNAVKTLVPLDQGFVFDRFFADLDKTLFFGADPFALLYAAGKPEWLLRALELNYSNFWFVICFGMVYWVAVSPRLDGIRVRYFVSFLLTWGIVGNVLATIFSSAGPVYYGHVTGDYAGSPSRSHSLRPQRTRLARRRATRPISGRCTSRATRAWEPASPPSRACTSR